MRAAHPAQEAVSPVVGTLLVLAITVLGMAGILIWGAPTIEAVQAQNAQVGVVGEFEELRSSSIDLSIPDASRIPTVNVPRGTLAVAQGTRVLVTASYDVDCDFRVRGWETQATTVTVTFTACSGTALEVLQVIGSNTVRKQSGAPAGTVTVAGVDFTRDNWLFRLSNGDDLNLQVYAEAWLFDSDQVQWSLGTANGGVAAFFDLGAVFSSNGPSYYLEKSLSLQENEFGTGVYSLRLRTLTDAGGAQAISGRGSHQVFLGLVGNHARIDRADVHSLRYDFYGELAESWCGMLMLRNEDLSGASYAEDATYPCIQASDFALRSVLFTHTPATPAGPLPAFEVELIHANIRVTLAD